MPDDFSDITPADEALEATQRLLHEDRTGEALTQLATLHPADQAEVIAQLDASLQTALLPRIPQEALAQILAFLNEEPRRSIVAELAPDLLGPVLDQVERDVAVDILHELPPERATAVLAGMASAADVAPLLAHTDDSAGGRMTSDFVALQQEWTVDQSLSYLRQNHPKAEQAFYLYVTDEQERLEGVVSLRQLVVAEPEARIGEMMTPEVVSVHTTDDQEETARRIERYDLVALPVVDDERRLVGVVSVDDLIDVIEAEATEDMYRMAGLAEGESLLRPLASSALPRLGWLLIALVSMSMAAIMVNVFEDTIAKAAALAVFMPVIAGLGGNAGIQTITLVVRSMTLGELELRQASRVLRRELALAIVNGVVIGVLVGILAFAWKGNVALGVVAGAALLLNIVTGVMAGVLVPLSLRALRLDPALASGVLVTTFTDVLGFFFFLGLATLMIDRLA